MLELELGLIRVKGLPAGADTDGGSVGSTPYLCWKMVGSFLRGREFFFGKIRHNKQKLSINLTSFPFIFDQMFTNSSF